MEKIKISVLMIAMLLMSGCAAGIVGQVPQVSDGFATVYIARKVGNAGCGSAILIQINDKDFIRIDCGMKTSFKIPAGEKTKISQVSSTRPDHFYLEPGKGEKYYFGADCNWVCWFDQLSESDYKRMASTCDKELKIEQMGKE